MTLRNTVWLLAPAVVLLAIGGIAEAALPGSFLDAATSVSLTLPPMLIALGLMVRLERRLASGVVIGLFAGMILKAGVAMVGGLALYAGTGWYADRGVALWLWLAVAYLAFLAVEIVVATRLLRTSETLRTG